MSETPQPRLPANGALRRAVVPTSSTLCDEMPDLAAAVALGALDREEAEAVERHREVCPTCARLIEEAERTAAMLPYLARLVSPAPDVRAALFARIAQAQHVRNPTASRTSGASPIVTLPSSRPRVVEERLARRGIRLPAFSYRGRAGASPDAAAAPARGNRGIWPGPAFPIATTTIPLMLILALVGGWAMTQYNRANEAAAYQELWGTMGNVLSSESGTVFELDRGAAAPPSATGRIIAEPDATDALLMVWGLSSDEGDVSYEVWVERNGRFVFAGNLDVDRRGNARELIDLAGRLRDCQRVVVTAQTVDASGQPETIDLLSTEITPEGPAAGGDGTEGGQQVGSLGPNVDLLAAASKRP